MLPIILTSDVTSWSLRPLLYLLGKYWPGHPRFLVGGYTKPGFYFDADWYKIGRFSDYPVKKWSDGLIDFLNAIKDDVILFMMDDYWLNRIVNQDAVFAFADYLHEHPEIARFDLTGDRLNASGWSEIGLIGGQQIIQDNPDSPYHFSFQAALWQRRALLDCLIPNESPWDAELNGDNRLRKLGYLVYGSQVPPMRYTIALQQGHFAAVDGGYQGTEYALPADDFAYITNNQWIPDRVLS